MDHMRLIPAKSNVDNINNGQVAGAGWITCGGTGHGQGKTTILDLWDRRGIITLADKRTHHSLPANSIR